MEQQAHRSQELQAGAPEQGQASLRPEASPCLRGGTGKAGPPAGVETVAGALGLPELLLS